MILIQYPEPEFQIKQEGGSPFIFDAIRKIWVVLTEEEWVRQNFIRYMITVLQYPQTMIAVEKSIVLYEIKKRFDILIYDKNFRPWMLVECKAPHILLSDDVLHQVLRYNLSTPVSFLIITNGKTTFGWEKKANHLQAIQQMPLWEI